MDDAPVTERRDLSAPRTSTLTQKGWGLERWRWIKRRLSILGLTGATLVLVILFGALFAPFLTDFDPTRQNLMNVLQGPSREHLLGTDNLGRDLFSRLLFGARTTLMISVVATTIGLVTGVFFGITAGYYGGRWDTLVMRSVDVMLSFPGILLALTMVAILGFDVQNIIIAIAIVSIPPFTRLSRGATLSVKEMEYVIAARALGAPDSRIISRHLFPNVLAPIVTLWTLRLGWTVLTASSLGFLGLGVQPPTPEWGAMLSDGRTYIQLDARLVVVPGIAITLVVLGFALLGDWLRDLMDPRMR